MNRQRLLDRFLQYVKVDTMACDDVDHYPSSPGQMELGKVILGQLHEMGLSNATQDEHGIVLATIPGNTDAPAVAFNAHLDTSPETTALGVQPQIVEAYDGQDIPLSGDPSKVITVDKCPALENLVGKTLITTDGTTLLGGDDKAGVAIIMELASHLLENPDIPHGPVRILFTCDEEIGRGAQHVDVAQVDATAAYTFDGGGRNHVDVETFSADLATVTIRGINTHPAYAKDKMVNAIRAAGKFLEAMPADAMPEKTADREGFLHPYAMDSGVAEVKMKVLLRSFDTQQLTVYAENLMAIAKSVEADMPGCQIQIEVTKQYRNLGDGLQKEPRAAAFALAAHRRLNREPIEAIIRGGTDGSQFTEMGLPTPNLSSGQHNIHSPLEFACLDEMVEACEVGVELVKIWSEGAEGSTSQ
ncbi:MAG: peptidase T [Pirellulaceae bacterium]|nr:peptidase T [Pirellulaceae bacterium]